MACFVTRDRPGRSGAASHGGMCIAAFNGRLGSDIAQTLAFATVQPLPMGRAGADQHKTALTIK